MTTLVLRLDAENVAVERYTTGYSPIVVPSRLPTIDEEIDDLMPNFYEWEQIAQRRRPPQEWYEGDEERLW